MIGSWKIYAGLHMLLLINSFGGICSKMAGRQIFFSAQFFLLYGIMTVILIIYAVMWQQIIKKMPLSTAYLNKSVGIMWGMLWGILFFQEHVSIRMIIGAFIVLCGVVMVVQTDE